jgi:hypothetical protein
MGDGPDAFYQLRWVGCAQDDDCRCSGRWSLSGEVRQLGAFVNRADVLRKMDERLERRGGQLKFRWFVGLPMDADVWPATMFAHNRDRLMDADVAREFLAALLALP